MKYWINKTISLDQENNPYKDYLAYVIANKEKNSPVGEVGCSFYKDLNEIGITYFIGGNDRKQGYASEAAKAYVEYFFAHYSVSKIIASVRPENKASCKVIEKTGFHFKMAKLYKDVNDKQPQGYYFYEKECDKMPPC